MQTTTFRCGHCGNLMAVSSEYLGQQVQCPTCRQVVLAPAATPPTPALPPTPEPAPVPNLPLEPISPPAPAPEPAPAPTVAGTSFPNLSLDTEHESIFSENTSDDLFDEPGPSLAAAPTVEYPPEAIPVQEPVPVPVPAPDPTPYSYPAQPVELQPAPVQAVSQQVDWSSSSGSQVAEEPRPTEELPRESQDRRQKKGPPVSWSTLLIVPLISYAILSTALIFYLWNRMEVIRASVANPLEAMPDIHGDAPGAKKKSVRTWKPDDSQALAALPNGHTVRLGEKLTVGNLEVQPLRVERGRPLIKQGTYNPEPTLNEALLLHLRFRNLSDEFSFAPLDNAFDRKWTGARADVPPLNYRPFTVLQVGSQNYFGGTPSWVPRVPPASMKKAAREWVEGPGRGETPVYLDPGQTLDTFVTTNGDREGEGIVPAALGHKGDLLWRVHVRQGPIAVKGRSDPIPSTTVVGVSFKASDVIRP